ncbi:hypothetical protein D3C71_2017960 [compost metagenome]
MNIKIKVISDKEFSSHITNLINNNNSDVLMGIINDLDEDNVLQYSNSIKVKSDITIKYLKSIGFEWKKIDSKYVESFINYLIDIEFLKKDKVI